MNTECATVPPLKKMDTEQERTPFVIGKRQDGVWMVSVVSGETTVSGSAKSLEAAMRMAVGQLLGDVKVIIGKDGQIGMGAGDYNAAVDAAMKTWAAGDAARRRLG